MILRFGWKSMQSDQVVKEAGLKALTIRDLVIDPPFLLAPMVSLTHSAFRQVVAGFGGVGLLSTEMLSAKRLPNENAVTSPYLARSASEKPLSYQILTSNVREIAPAIEALHKLKADAIDLNLGCPAPAVRKFGAGIRLMDQPEDVRRIAAEARKRTHLPLTAKIRLGIEDERQLMTFCRMLEGEGIDMLSVHARFKKESFARKPRWEWIAKIKEWLTIPVIANGGIFSTRDAEECLRISGADGLMLGRGAVIKPWLFAEITRELYGRLEIGEPAVSLPALYSRFIDILNEQFLPEYRLRRLKQYTCYFAQNYQFGHHLASRIQSSNSLDEARERAGVFLSQVPAV